MDKRIAVLIDADNVSAKYIKPILDELSKYGNVTCKRIYGDWTDTRHTTWKEELLTNSISPIQQFSYTTGKNATDSAMIIDAMDLLYAGTVDSFCIVSSDSDFTRLAARLRESGMWVIGMGEEKTPQPFRKACDIFTCLELLIEEEAVSSHKLNETTEDTQTITENTVKKNGKSAATNKKVLEEAVIRMITENQNSERETGLGEVGSRLVKLYPDFDVRSYGYSLLSKLLEDMSRIRLVKQGNSIYVELFDDDVAREMVEDYVVRTVKEDGNAGISLRTLSQKLNNEFPGFRVRNYGFTQLNKFVREIEHMEIFGNGQQMRVRFK